MRTLLIAALVLGSGLEPRRADAEPNFPNLINNWCTQQQRIPPQPIPLAFPASCDVCHVAPIYDDNSQVQPAFNETLAGLDTSDFSYFCPLLANGNTPPVLEPIGDRSVQEGAMLAFRIAATDIDEDALVTSASDLPPGASFTDNGDGTGDFNWTPNYGQAGNYPVTFTVIDSSPEMGSASEQITISVGNVNRPPSLASIGNHSVDEGATLSFSVMASDPDQDPITLSAADLPAGASFSDGGSGAAQFSWTPGYDQAANFSVTMMATDQGAPPAADSETFTITVGDVNRPPVLATIGNRAADPDVLIAIPISAADPDGDALSFSAAGLPAGAEFVDLGNGSADFSWVPTSGQAGNHAVTFTVTDSGAPAAADSEQITITVGAVNRPPVLGAIGNRTVEVGSELTFVVTASDPDGDTLAFTADVPPGASFVDNGDGTAEFSWVPTPDQVGNHDASFTVSDSGEPTMEQDTWQITISVGGINRPPALAPIGDQRVLAEQALTLIITASDPDGDALTCEASGLPAGASFTDNGDGTAELYWVPGPDQIGRHDVTVTVHDSGEPVGSDVEIFGIQVDPTEPTDVPPTEMPPVEMRAAWDCEDGELRVRAGGLPPRTRVEIHDAGSGEVIGRRTTSRRGTLRYRARLASSPQGVQLGLTLEGEYVRTAPVRVRGADASCERELELEAEWDCEDHELEVEGEDLPPGASIEVRDAASGALLGITTADRSGEFELETQLGAPVQQVRVTVEVDGEPLLDEALRVEDADRPCTEEEDDD